MLLFCAAHAQLGASLNGPMLSGCHVAQPWVPIWRCSVSDLHMTALDQAG